MSPFPKASPLPFEDRPIRFLTPKVIVWLIGVAITATAGLTGMWANLHAGQADNSLQIVALQDRASKMDGAARADHDLLIRMNGKLDVLLSAKDGAR